MSVVLKVGVIVVWWVNSVWCLTSASRCAGRENTVPAGQAVPDLPDPDEEVRPYRRRRPAVEVHRLACLEHRTQTTGPARTGLRPGRWRTCTTFLAWATGKDSQADLAHGNDRAFCRRIAWCWAVEVPKAPATGEVHSQVFIDGVWLAHKWVLLVARSQTGVIGWQWAASESAAAYTALLAPIAPPDLVTTDGASGALKAIRATWPDTPVQRCLIHIRQDTVRDLTLHPQTTPGKALLGLSRKLLKVSTPEQAAQWLVKRPRFCSASFSGWSPVLVSGVDCRCG
ncbi:Transposase, Mutator family [Actinomyces bovis]|uniref:Transposase, Mutator family n=1 Tax=Actinomyces bovis TaxID=1658 RepID=A0ABY1VNZ7_9ACTO|nr:transposase [Actinomyces bovis]SPT53831.1 Transposase, Mutator family [Actinomyces bovis]VEG53206.1 Transposase, Mutator family [Actinomyces israelii]